MKIPSHIPKIASFTLDLKPFNGKTFVWDRNSLGVVYTEEILERYKNQMSKRKGICYFITINQEIVKIGCSDNSGGISGIIGGYAKGNTGECKRSFICNYLIREELQKGNEVEFYAFISEPTPIKVKGMFGDGEGVITLGKQMESLSLSQFKEKTGETPSWNFVEQASRHRSDLNKKWTEYLRIRREQKD